MNANYRKVMVAGATAAVIVGAGGTALAVTGSTTTTGKAGHTSGQKAGKHKHHKGGENMLRGLEYGTFVTRGKDGKTVTHDLIKGTVSAVTATSVSVRVADRKPETFIVTKDTKIKERVKGQKPVTVTIDKIVKGDHVFVAGTGTTTLTAQHIVESAKK